MGMTDDRWRQREIRDVSFEQSVEIEDASFQNVHFYMKQNTLFITISTFVFQIKD